MPQPARCAVQPTVLYHPSRLLRHSPVCAAKPSHILASPPALLPSPPPQLSPLTPPIPLMPLSPLTPFSPLAPLSHPIPRLSQPACAVAQPPALFSPHALPLRLPLSPARATHQPSIPRHYPRLRHSAIHTAWLVSAIQPAYAIAQSAAPLSRPHRSAGPRRPVRLRSSARYAAQSAPTVRLICAVQPARVIQSTRVAQSAASASPPCQPVRCTVQPAVPPSPLPSFSSPRCHS